MKFGRSTDSPPTPGRGAACSSDRCGTGACGGRGLCPGIAFLVAYAIGGGIAWLSGLDWLGWAVGVPLALILISGAWRFLPGISKPASEVQDPSAERRGDL